jgi:hypothetical protein
MTFALGAVLVKGGKIISTGYNHRRTRYDGSDIEKRGFSTPLSLHAEMDAIRNLTGVTPSFKKQLPGTQGYPTPVKRRGRLASPTSVENPGCEQRLLSTNSPQQELSCQSGKKDDPQDK